MSSFRLVNARVWRPDTGLDARPSELSVVDGHIAPSGAAGLAPTVDLDGRIVLPGLVNGHDHLELASVPPLGRPPYASLYAWADDVRAGAGEPSSAAGLSVPFLDRLYLGGLRNLLCGVTTVAHHGQYRRSFERPVFELATRLRHGFWPRAPFPVRVVKRYGWAHSPGLEPDLARARARTPRGAPFMIHAAEGVDTRASGEIAELEGRGLLDPQAVLVHAIAASDADVARIRASGAGVVWCPESNLHLYGRTAPVAELLASGVRLGLGSDSPISGGRDLLSTLAAARGMGLLSDDALLRLATRDTAALLGLARAGLEPGDPADLIVVDDLERLLRGERAALQLVVQAGRALLGEADLARPLLGAGTPLELESCRLVLEPNYARLLQRLLARHASIGGLPWLRELTLAGRQPR